MSSSAEQAGASVSGRKRLGELALEKGLISSHQLTDALHAQGELQKLGLSERIGTILFRKKLLSKQALDDLLQEQTTQADAAKPKKLRRLGNFELHEKVGQGAMGVVFRARQITMDRTVAVKILAPKYADDEAFIKRFVREARAAGQFSHENIVTALDVGFIEPYHYFVMEYVEGQTLRKVVAERGRVPEAEALEYARQIAKGLDHALTKKILHRDVKPENVIVTPQGVAKLLDMGLACVVGASEDDDAAEADPKKRKAAGTPHYISPEAARGEDLDTRADIYSLGCTLYHLLAGTTPYEGTHGRAIMARHVAEPFPDIREKRPKLSEHAVRILERMTAKDREKRYADPGQVIEDLDAVLHGAVPKHAAPPADGKSGRQRAAGATTGPRAPIGERGTTGPRSPIRPRGTTTGPAAPILGDRTGGLAPTQPGAAAAKAKEAEAKSGAGLWIGAAVAAVALLCLGLAFSGGSDKKTAKAPPAKSELPTEKSVAEPIKKVEIKAPLGPSREQFAREALDAALKLEKEQPEGYAQVLPALEHAVEQSKETPVAKLAADALSEAQGRHAKALDATLQKAQAAAAVAAAKSDWKAAQEALRDEAFPEGLRAGDWKQRLGDARQTEAAKPEAAAAKLLAAARAKAQGLSQKGFEEAIELAQQAEAIPAEYAASAQQAAEEHARWSAALEELKKKDELDRAAKQEKGRELAFAVRKEMQPLLQGNRFSAARELLEAKQREQAHADAAEALKQEGADLDALLSIRKDAIETLRKSAGEKVTLTKGNAKLTGTVKDAPGTAGVSLKLSDGPEFTLGPEQLDAADVDAYAPKPAGEAAKENLRRRGLLFLASGDFPKARAYFTQALA
ncbi:MAG: serine/threonine protein kinase, partial [Planctomycetes bacterium]|nr:serine/threonine protein kinase [Planctomycetota bacterium]